jgi:hypothetical protein
MSLRVDDLNTEFSYVRLSVSVVVRNFLRRTAACKEFSISRKLEGVKGLGTGMYAASAAE